MNSRLRNAVCASALALAAGLAALPARASVIVSDQYYGAENTYNSADVIGPTSVFDTTDMVIDRIGINEVRITIDTNYAGVPGTSASDGTGYGALYIALGANAWQPCGTAADHYACDEYSTTGTNWQYAATIPEVPGSSSGSGGLYLLSGGTIVMSNVLGDTHTAPHAGNNGYYFREGQAVQFDPGPQQLGILGTSETWTIGAGTITFDIIDNGFLGNDFALSWAMTCGNDVIQGQVSLPQVPEPPSWSLLLAGLALAGGMALRRARKPA